MLTVEMVDREMRSSSEKWAIKTGEPQEWEHVKAMWNLSDASVRPWWPPRGLLAMRRLPDMMRCRCTVTAR